MKIKIGDKFYDPNEEPVMLILNDQDKENIKNMHPEATKYCAYPEGTDKEFIREWMEKDDERETI